MPASEILKGESNMDTCVTCGSYVPEGRQICPLCENLSGLKDSGDRREFGTGAVRDMAQGKGRYDLIPWEAIHELALHCEQGATKYGEHNINKGIPLHSPVDSAARHLAKFISGHRDEEHLTAACWNLMWALEFMVTKPELNDLYHWQEEAK